MKKLFLAAITLVVLGLVFAGGAWVGWRSAVPRGAATARTLRYYTCPMHPQYHADRPGDCPSCGMRLEAVYTDGAGVVASANLPPGGVTVSPQKQQLIGVRTAVAEVSPVHRMIRTVGRVDVDEDRVYRVVATVDGVVRDLRRNSAGHFVERDEVLLSYYSTEFLSAQQAFFFALNTHDRIKGDRSEPTEQMILTRSQLRSTVDTLRNLGMSDTQIAELGRTRKLVRDIQLRSPISGFVLSRSVLPQQRLERGGELYRIADLGRLWVLADLFEADAPYVRPGATAILTQRTQSATPIRAAISNVLPQFDRTSGTLKVKLEIDNSNLALRPDMFVNVEIPASLPAAVTVPLDAVVDSGRRTLVFVQKGEGYFEPRRVETGWRADDRVEIVKGLSAGERIVVSGSFLLDSESRMRVTEMDVANAETDPVCGMTVDRAQAEAKGLSAAHAGGARHFCSEECKKKFIANPSAYVPQGAAPQLPAKPAARPFGATLPVRKAAATRELPDYLQRNDDELNTTVAAAEGRTIFATDPVCGAEVDTTAPDALKSEFKGRKYYFVSPECKTEFEKDPAKYVK